MKKQIIKYSIFIGVMLLVSFAIAMLSGVVSETNTTADVMQKLCDAFAIPGLIVFAFGLLVVASNGGAFDMLAYGMIALFSVFRRDVTKRRHRTFYDYRLAKSENKRSFWSILIVGTLFIALAGIFLLLYNYFLQNG